MQDRSIIDRITTHTDGIEIDLSRDGLAFHLPAPIDKETQSADPIKITAPITVRKRGQEMKLVLGAKNEPVSCPDETLITLIARAVHLRDQLETGEVASIGDFARQQGLDHSNTNKLVSLGYLAPSIVEDILQGRQHEGFRVGSCSG
ncbi:MAG: hypothetical protein ACSHX3_08655 [Litorimonas sp.]